MFFSVLCPVSVLSHSVESCGTCLTRPGIVFHNELKFVISYNSDFRGTSLSPRSVRKENVYELKFFISYNLDFRGTSVSPKTSKVFIKRTSNGLYMSFLKKLVSQEENLIF